MKKLTVRSLLLGLLLGLFLMQPWTTQTVKADEIGDCGMPYVLDNIVVCTFWGVFCWDTQLACTNCDGGTYCYNL